MGALVALKTRGDDGEDGDRLTLNSPPKEEERSLFIVARRPPDAETELSWLCSEGVAHAGF